MASVPPHDDPSGAPRDDLSETHFEWLARLLVEGDRRQTPFHYRRNPPPAERRRWDALASLTAPRSG